MRRPLVILLAVLLATPLLLWAAFRIWLVSQPDAFRAQIEQYSTLEFAGILRNTVFPPPFLDRGTFGRRDHPGRGNSPWVLRSSLDGRPRMLSIALAPERWLAYSTETASIHQLWRGDIEYSGPVYDAQHGSEPTSRGTAYLHLPVATAWRVFDGGKWQPAEVRWRGHGFEPANGALWIRYELSGPSGARRRVTEWPERIDSGAEKDEAAMTLERRFALSGDLEVALRLGPMPESASVDVDGGLERRGDRVVFAPSNVDARIAYRFSAASLPLAIEVETEEATDPFARHDCHSCHNVRERVMGPAWSEVALRHAGTNHAIATEQLARRIREGSVGQWGSVVMPPHPDLDGAEARTLARAILETEPSEAPTVVVDTRGAEATWSFSSQTEEPPDALHPSLASTPVDPPGFTPKVGGLAWLADGRLAVSTWDRDGAVYAVEGWQGPADRVRVERIADGLHEPLGLATVGDELYVMQKQEITQLVDHNGDGWTDEYRTIANDWSVTSNFHEFGFGLIARGDDLYASLSVCVLTGGKSCRDQTPDRGRVLRASRTTGEVEFLASGMRTPNGLALSPTGELFVTDNQGDWLPASKLIRVRPGEYYGWRAPGDTRDLGPVTPPALWLPQNEVGNSPTQPLFLERGPYAGDVLFGDIFNGGLKRGVLEEVDGQLQGAVFHFSGGFEGPINRLLATPDGGFVVGQAGSRGNWGEPGKDWYGLEVVSFRDEPAFEPRRVMLRPGGFEIELTRPLAEDADPDADDFGLTDWFYVPSEIYGGPKYDLRTLAVSGVAVSRDRLRLRLDVEGLEPGRIVYLHLGDRLRSQRGESLWVNESWYTLNALAPETSDQPADDVAGSPPNTLTDSERAQGWRLLFDGERFEGWKVYAADDDPAPFWTIDDQALHFTRDVSLAGLAWNHLNPFTPGALDLMTRERFGDFEFLIDWRISEGGNSGIFYAVPDESSPLSWDLGLEMQVLDDARHRDGQIDRHRAGDLYDLQSLARGASRPVGAWNTARIRVRGDHVEQWLNGVKTADIVRGGRAWDEAIAASKFADTQGFGRARRGHITLQDHGDLVWFRNIKLRSLDEVVEP